MTSGGPAAQESRAEAPDDTRPGLAEVRFGLSRSALDRAASTYSASSSGTVRTDKPSRRVGSFEISRVVDQDGVVLLYTSGGDELGDTGFAYVPPGSVVSDLDVWRGGLASLTPLRGRWYVFQTDG
jgi:hypothetical protein